VSTVLVTGGTGCIGAATARKLVDRGSEGVILVSRGGDTSTVRLWFEDAPPDRIVLARADLAAPDRAAALLADHRPTHVIHLAGLQSPDCDADPAQGLAVNVGGTLSLLRALEESPAAVERFVFASSGAVYGRRSDYLSDTIGEEDPLLPPNLYGVWKVTGEHLARLYHRATGVPTVCLRLNTTYGLGRDRGRTSAATTAIKAVALGHHTRRTIPYRMPYRGRENYHYVEDVGDHFAGCALEPFDGYGAFNIRGTTIEVADYLGLLRGAAETLGMGDAADLGIAEGAPESIFSCDLDEKAVLEKFPEVPKTPLAEGLRRSLVAFERLAGRAGLAL
jgi:nucleoside-diphosphate-sugar epimerase